MVITKGKQGAEFYYQHKLYIFSLRKPLKEVETNGCGDAFFSVIIKNFLKEKNWNEEKLKKLFIEASEYINIVLNNIGARNHIIKNGTILSYEKCLCQTINIK